MALPSADTLEALSRLCSDPLNVVYIISGRDGEFLDQHLGHLKLLGMSAEHGGFIREPGQEGWTNFTEKLDMDWMGEVHEVFRYYTEVRCRKLLPSCGLTLIFDSPARCSGLLAVISRSRKAQLHGTIGVPIQNGGEFLFSLLCGTVPLQGLSKIQAVPVQAVPRSAREQSSAQASHRG
jgi:hypothetical protein